MGAKTGIEWTDHTFNAWIGCTKVSEGCRNCYAARDNKHWKWNGGAWGPGALRKVTSLGNWRDPLKWAKAARAAGVRERVFLNSLADTFDAEAPRLARKDLWLLIGDTYDALDWQILTKRPERIPEVMCEDGLNLGFFELCKCWLGTTAENQAAADMRIPALLEVDAAVRFVSCEPLLGPVNVSKYLGIQHEDEIGIENRDQRIADEMNKLGGLPMRDPWVWGIDWVIAGGESGPGARRMNSEWVEALQDQCAAAGVAFFFKQWGDCYRQHYGANCAWHPDGWNPGACKGGSSLRGIEYKQFPAVRP